jgi:hypothetical protein
MVLTVDGQRLGGVNKPGMVACAIPSPALIERFFSARRNSKKTALGLALGCGNHLCLNRIRTVLQWQRNRL